MGKVTGILAVAFFLIVLSACGKTTTGSSASDESKQSNSRDSNTAKSDNNNSSNSNTLDQRIDGILDATLEYKNKKSGVKVDFKDKTMMEGGKKVGFSIVPDQDSQNDFKKGTIKEIIDNKDESHNLTLFEYSINEKNQISLIDPATNKVVYKKTIK